jgi:hypothetical protein
VFLGQDGALVDIKVGDVGESKVGRR